MVGNLEFDLKMTTYLATKNKNGKKLGKDGDILDSD